MGSRYFSLEMHLREMCERDLELVMAWRSNPMVYRGFYLQNAPLTWAEHINWWKSRKKRMDWIIYLNRGDGRFSPVGCVNVSSLEDDIPEVGIMIGEVSLWGKGIGRRAVQMAVDALRGWGHKRARASILEDNMGSIKLFESVGFCCIGGARIGELAYEINLEA